MCSTSLRWADVWKGGLDAAAHQFPWPEANSRDFESDEIGGERSQMTGLHQGYRGYWQEYGLYKARRRFVVP